MPIIKNKTIIENAAPVAFFLLRKTEQKNAVVAKETRNKNAHVNPQKNSEYEIS